MERSEHKLYVGIYPAPIFVEGRISKIGAGFTSHKQRSVSKKIDLCHPSDSINQVLIEYGLRSSVKYSLEGTGYTKAKGVLTRSTSEADTGLNTDSSTFAIS